MFFKSPAIPTSNGEMNQLEDANTVALREQLNSVHEIQYTQPSYNHSYFLSAGIDDRDYNVGYKQVPVGNQVSVLAHHFEAPEVPVTQLSYKESLFNSTLVQKTVNGTPVIAMRAPGINEGF